MRSRQIKFIIEIKDLADQFPESEKLPVLFSTRKATQSRKQSGHTLDALVQNINQIVESLCSRGYFQKIFGPDCPDLLTQSSFKQIAEKHGLSEVEWPLDSSYIILFSIDVLFDAIELLDYYVAAPIERYWHHFGDPHWDYSQFNRTRGRAVFRWEVNRILSNSEFPYEMGTDGETARQIVESVKPEFADLTEGIIEQSSTDDKNQMIQHALCLYLGREMTSSRIRGPHVFL